jgi:hypothetical protein
LIIGRRFLVLVAFAFWQGGFTFYAGVVVPVGQEVLGSHTEQGFITRRVTPSLNLAGSVALLVFAWDTAAASAGARSCRRARWLCWIGMAMTLGLLFWLHSRLDAHLDLERHQVLDRPYFRQAHRAYLWISTVQWAFAAIYMVFTVRAWRAGDQARAVR